MDSLQLRKKLDRSMRMERSNTTWHGTAFVIEALVLLVFLAAALAVFFTLLASSHMQSVENEKMAGAAVVATSTAEQFAATPTDVPATQNQGIYTVELITTPNKMEGGTMYKGEIVVYEGDRELFGMNTSRYVSEVK